LGKALLGELLRDGEGGPAEPEKGAALLQEAAAAGVSGESGRLKALTGR
jgi:hypothetical protein